MEFSKVVQIPAGPRRTAALAAWVQSLYASEAEMPVLVGGAAVELYTGGAYVTGDLDFVGHVPAEVAAAFKAAGFQKRGRHWVHEESRVFLEFPSGCLTAGEQTLWMTRRPWKILAVSPEDLLLDRLASWTFWKDIQDGVNAFHLVWLVGEKLDWEHLRARAKDLGLEAALHALENFMPEPGRKKPRISRVIRWSQEGRP